MQVGVTKASRNELLGYIYGISTGICYGVMTVLSKTAVRDYATPLIASAIMMGLGGLMVAPLAVPGVVQATRRAGKFVLIFALSGLTGGMGVISIMFGLKHADVVVVAPLIAASPLMTLILARIFLNRLERITTTLVAGTLLVVGGTVLVTVGSTT